MVTFSKHSKRSLHRKGKQLLKSKIGLYKRRKTTLLNLKSKTKMFVPTIVLPPSLQPSSYLRRSSIRTVHTSTKRSAAATIAFKTAVSSSPFQDGFSSKSTNTKAQSDDQRGSSKGSVGVGSGAEPKKPRKISIKKFLGIKKDKKSPMKTKANAKTKAADVPRNVTVSEIAGKDSTDVVALEDSDSENTADSTNPNTPVRGRDNTDNNNDNENRHSLPATQSMESSNSRKSHGPYIFSDTDDDDDENRHSSDKEKQGSGYTVTFTAADQRRQPEDSEECIQARVEHELESLFARLRNKKAERRATTQEKIENARSEEKSDIDGDGVSTEEGSPIGPQTFPTAQRKQTRGFSFLFLLLPAVLLMHWFFSEVWVTTPYSHDIATERAQKFFGTTGSTETPMKGMTVVLSETESKLGSTIEDRFARLGATVASIQEQHIDCNDLNSVAKSVDSLIKKHTKIDFLVHTGNLCLKQNTIESMTSKTTVQGHDALFGGNYLSPFLVTQKILPNLEQSRFGTLVQFTSQASAFAGGSKLLEIEAVESSSSPPPGASVLMQQQQTYLSMLLHLPLQFASVKLSEILQHRVLSRAYPNVRTMEISNGWIGIGEKGANEFFDRVFESNEESVRGIPFSSAITTIAENEDLQDGLYEWSQNAVWKWVVSPTLPPVTEMILGSPISQQPIYQAAVHSEKKSPSFVNKYFPANTAAVVTSSALALLAMKAKTLSGASGSSWWSSE
jgi:hypothetical protein